MSLRVPYGSWPSGWRAEDAAQAPRTVDWTGFAGSRVRWVAADPADGRNHLLTAGAPGQVTDVLPPGWDVRTAYQEYGGRPWTAGPRGATVFVHWNDQRLHRHVPDGTVVALGPASGDRRYADPVIRGDEVWCLRESGGVRRHLVAVPLDGSRSERVLAGTHEFLTGPRVSPDGTGVAWTGWNHPDMPWVRTDVMVARVTTEGRLTGVRRLATGPDESVTQVEWSADGRSLLVVSDRDGWWNPYRVDDDDRWHPICPRPEEFGEALWRVGASTIAALPGGALAAAHGTGTRRLSVLGADGDLTAAGPDLNGWTDWQSVTASGNRIAAVAAGPGRPPAVVLTGSGRTDVLWTTPGIPAGHLPPPVHRTYAGVHAYVYEPCHPRVTGPTGESPPYLIQAHGGPTSRSRPGGVEAAIAFFTSRGIGVADVQYSGSTGFGRVYRDRLRHRWGIADVQDCATVARALIAEGRADPHRLALRGASAGGWTALRALVDEPGLFHAAAVSFPVLDAASWAATTHDFESRYADWLVGDAVADRSPIADADRIRGSVLLMQGARDAICLPRDADRFVERLCRSSVAVRYLRFRHEGHGFRDPGVVAECLRAELDLYGSAFGFILPGNGAELS